MQTSPRNSAWLQSDSEVSGVTAAASVSERLLESRLVSSTDFNRRNAMSQVLFRLWKEEQGQDFTEDALLLLLLSLPPIATLATLTTPNNTVITTPASTLTT